MKPIRSILLTILLTVAIFATISYTSCKNDPCINVICLNLGACDDGHCVCPTGFEGDRCEKLSRDKFIKTFNGYDTCTIDVNGGHRYYPLYFRAILSNPHELIMQGILKDLDDSAVCTMLGIDSFIFVGSNNATTYSGTGKMRHDSLWLIYEVIHDTTAYSCTYFGEGLR